MISRRSLIAGAASLSLAFSYAAAASALTVSCAGASSASSITWSASASGGVEPFAFLWGNGSTSTSQTISGAPGTYTMSIQATDASSSVATSSCSAAIAQAAPIISSFTATPSSVVSGQSVTLSWAVANASSTSIDNGIGAVSGTSISVTPSITTTYRLSATNPSGTTAASATAAVSATSTSASVAQQIQALLSQIAALRAQIAALLAQQAGLSASSTPPGPPPFACARFERDLSEGDEGDDVRSLQQTLSKDPSLFPPGLVTGFFGPRTKHALEKFQEMHGIVGAASSTTGFFGPRSRNLLNKECPLENDSGGGEHMGMGSASTTMTQMMAPNPDGGHGGHGRDKGGDGHDD